MRINDIKAMMEANHIVFLTYAGFLSQTLITGMTEALEKETEHGGLGMAESTNVFTIFIEMAQNIMNYAISQKGQTVAPKPEGLIVVSRCADGSCYMVQSLNSVAEVDKQKIETRLQEILALDAEGLRKRYRELRRSGSQSHERGGGLGLYEIAKRCQQIEFSFNPTDNQKFEFQLMATINVNKEVDV